MKVVPTNQILKDVKQYLKHDCELKLAHGHHMTRRGHAFCHGN